MSDSFGVQITGLNELTSKFSNFTEALQVELEAAVRAATELVYVQAKDNISRMFHNPGPMMNALQAVTERLSTGEIQGTVWITGTGYVTQEFGGQGPYDIFPRNSSVLAFSGLPWGATHIRGRLFRDTRGRFTSAASGTIFAHHVHHPALAERSYLRLALEQRQVEIEAIFNAVGARSWESR